MSKTPPAKARREFPCKEDALRHYSQHIVSLGSYWKVRKGDRTRAYLRCSAPGCPATVLISFRSDGSVTANESQLAHTDHDEGSPAPLLAYVHMVTASILDEAPYISMTQYYNIAQEIIGYPVARKVLWRARRHVEQHLQDKDKRSNETLLPEEED